VRACVFYFLYGEADFLLFYPKKTIAELDSIIEDGKFVTSACLTGFIDGGDCWTNSLSCEEVEEDESSLIGDHGNDSYEFHLIQRLMNVLVDICSIDSFRFVYNGFHPNFSVPNSLFFL
jgi:hypothetical protein